MFQKGNKNKRYSKFSPAIHQTPRMTLAAWIFITMYIVCLIGRKNWWMVKTCVTSHNMIFTLTHGKVATLTHSYFLWSVTYFMNSQPILMKCSLECNIPSQDWNLYAINNGMGDTKKAMTMYDEAEGDWVNGKQYYRA